MRPLAHVLFDEAHRAAWTIRPEIAAAMNPANPADAGYTLAAAALTDAGFDVTAHVEGPLTDDLLRGVDVLVLPHCSEDDWEKTTGVGSPRYTPDEIDRIEQFVRAGGGLVLFAETEQRKYGNSVTDIAARFGVGVDNVTVQDPVHSFRDVPTWIRAVATGRDRQQGDDILAGVGEMCLYRAGTLTAGGDSVVVATTSASALPASAPVLVATRVDLGRVIVIADSDLFGDDSIGDLDHATLWRNIVTWTIAHDRATRGSEPEVVDPAWDRLAHAIEAIRPLQANDGSIDDRIKASALIDQVIAAIRELAPRFDHQREHLELTIADLQRWRDEGFGVPDFLDSLLAFHPEMHREDGREHLAVFPMYTQNGNLARNLEAVHLRTVWPTWLESIEATSYTNAAFVPIEFVHFTRGYETHSAVLFPETVATREVARFTWGGIFCDRESARFRRVTSAAAQRLHLALPPEAALLVSDQALAQETFMLWDLVHDRTHSRGDLPFDPFMIKQRMPYWMYALEELRCDLTTYREMGRIADNPLSPYVRYAILFDRLFRFPTTGDRVRNYDGLGGQIIFAWLHARDVLRWTDNTLTLDWEALPVAMESLCAAVDELYRSGIDRSKIAHWLAAHAFISELVPAHPASTWAQGASALPLDAEPKALIDAVLPDEFPLNIFYEALRRELAPVIESTSGITGRSTLASLGS